jgi:NADH dehydrogenase [ubiquinone] 1 alpha subcomplex assembly factor 1
MTMYKERIRSVGISLLGGNSGVEGPYELGVDSVRAVNEEDAVILGEPTSFSLSSATKSIDRPAEKDPSEGTRWERSPL